jgi:uroporphyrinogen III methyltransferase/synthase
MADAGGDFRVVITRAAERADEIAGLLRDIGAEPIILPTITFTDPEDWSAVDTAIETLDTFDWVLFTSSTAVERFVDRVERLGRMEALRKQHISAVGPVTKEALEERGVKVAFMPSGFSSSQLLMELGPDVAGRSVLLPRGDIADPSLPEGLASLGSEVVEVVVYRTAAPLGLRKQAKEVFQSGVRLVCFTSPSTVKNLVSALGSEASVLRDVPAAVIGPTSAIAAQEAGLTIAVRAKQSTVAGLVESIREWKERQNGD